MGVDTMNIVNIGLASRVLFEQASIARDTVKDTGKSIEEAVNLTISDEARFLSALSTGRQPLQSIALSASDVRIIQYKTQLISSMNSSAGDWSPLMMSGSGGLEDSLQNLAHAFISLHVQNAGGQGQ